MNSDVNFLLVILALLTVAVVLGSGMYWFLVLHSAFSYRQAGYTWRESINLARAVFK